MCRMINSLDKTTILTCLEVVDFHRVGDVVLSESDFKDSLAGWDWSFFFHSVNCLGSEFNDASWRMMKGEVVCAALEMCSGGQAKYVDEVGFDMLVGDTKVEVKTEFGIIHRNLGRTKKIQLKNIRARAGEVPVLRRTFDYLLIINTGPPFVSAFATWETVERNQEPTADQIQCQLKQSDIVFTTSLTGVPVSDKVSSRSSLKDYVKEGFDEWLADIREQLGDAPESNSDSQITDY